MNLGCNYHVKNEDSRKFTESECPLSRNFQYPKVSRETCWRDSSDHLYQMIHCD